MLLLKDVAYTFTGSFGRTRTGKTVTVSILDEDGNAVVAGFTAEAVVELGDGVYGVKITFTTAMIGYIKWSNAEDVLYSFDTFNCVADYRDEITIIRKISTNRWKITANQLILYDDNGTSALYTFNLLKAGVADGDEPDERVIA